MSASIVIDSPMGTQEPIKNTDLSEAFECFDYLSDDCIRSMCVFLMKSHLYRDVDNLIQTCHRVSQLGQPFLKAEHDNFCRQPPTKVSTKQDVVIREWHDAQGRLDRSYDLPAMVASDGSQSWYRHGLLHCEHDHPAVIQFNLALHTFDGSTITSTENHRFSPYKYQQQLAEVKLHKHKKFLDIFPMIRQEWYWQGRKHRDGDQPAVILANGTKEWWNHGVYHRDFDRPAIVLPDGTMSWYQHGELHREGDSPAIICSDHSQAWYQFGMLHRLDDLPAVVLDDGTRKWYQFGKLHRENNQPAIIGSDGRQEWYQHGQVNPNPNQLGLELITPKSKLNLSGIRSSVRDLPLAGPTPAELEALAIDQLVRVGRGRGAPSLYDRGGRTQSMTRVMQAQLQLTRKSH